MITNALMFGIGVLWREEEQRTPTKSMSQAIVVVIEVSVEV